jgi:DNA-binding HxlR family transcriptional regulator
VPARVEYSLTEYGESLGPVTEAMCQWGKAHMTARTARRQLEVHLRRLAIPTSRAASR